MQIIDVFTINLAKLLLQHQHGDGDSMKLWKYNTITGYWVMVRTCDADTASQWLDIFQKDEPTGQFKLSKNTPKYPKA